MGLFGEIARAAANAAVDAAKEKAAEAVESKISGLATAKPELVFSGVHERQVYVYYGKPLKRVHRDDSFYADIVTKPTKLVSELTGGVWDTSTDGVALAYKGKVFGATGVLRQTFRKLERKGYRVRVQCKMIGWFAPGIPEILMMIPDPDEIFRWMDDCERTGEEVPFDEWRARG